MPKKLQKIIETKIKNNLKLKQYKELNLIELNEISYLLSKNNYFLEAKEIIDYILKFQKRTGEFIKKEKKENIIKNTILFLNTITEYLKQNNYNKNKSNFQQYIKYIKKSILIIENNFDPIFLLIKTNKKPINTENIFIAKENAKILNFAEDLCQILNEYDFNKIADKLFLLKEKIQLGFKRYFIINNNNNNKEEIILKKFNTNGEFEFLTKIETLEILENSKLKNKINLKLELNKLTSNKKEIKTENLIILLNKLKTINNKEFKKEIKKYYNIFQYSPKKIIITKEYNKNLKIKLSINKTFNEKTKQIQNYTLKELNNLKILCLILNIIKNE